MLSLRCVCISCCQCESPVDFHVPNNTGWRVLLDGSINLNLLRERESHIVSIQVGEISDVSILGDDKVNVIAY